MSEMAGVCQVQNLYIVEAYCIWPLTVGNGPSAVYTTPKFGNKAESVNGHGHVATIRRNGLHQGRGLPYAEKDLPPGSPNAFESLFITLLKPDIMQRH